MASPWMKLQKSESLLRIDSLQGIRRSHLFYLIGLLLLNLPVVQRNPDLSFPHLKKQPQLQQATTSQHIWMKELSQHHRLKQLGDISSGGLQYLKIVPRFQKWLLITVRLQHPLLMLNVPSLLGAFRYLTCSTT
ncbi:hypothetical protein FA15DRAFT_76598 [Coprinopsis marcescibilis]|uniref:Uncharacterized protein n=1 Tax=Coprinopsis marcescibilis TaxID=230819 RepID=A0A5C3L6E4_COPMA|nr:hypothetical protein FA15DRAFT_76598 [Coprinopsis marcescibilis]